jgi:hypothetical protein
VLPSFEVAGVAGGLMVVASLKDHVAKGVIVGNIHIPAPGK